MFLTYFWNVAIYILLILSIDFVTTTVEKCFLEEEEGRYYSRNASKEYGEILNTSVSKNPEECRRKCCRNGQCNLMMFSTVLRNKGSTNITCFLLNCPEISRCKTKSLPNNITGISIVGLKLENIAEHTSNNISYYNNSNVEKHKIYEPQSNSTILMSETKSHSSASIIQPLNATNKNIKATSSSPKDMHSPLKSTAILLNPVVHIRNTSHSLLSKITSSQSISDMHTPGIQTRFNHSFLLMSYLLKSKSNTSHSAVFTTMHSQPLLHVNTPIIQEKLMAHSSHLVSSSGTNETVDVGSTLMHNQNKTMDKLPHRSVHNSLLMSVNLMVNSSKSYIVSTVITSSPSSTFARPHSTTDAVLLRIVSEGLNTANGSTNVSSLLHNHQASKSSLTSTTTSHISKGGQKKHKKFSEQEHHTTPVSLVISLIIGILFFGTVVFLIGRRWSEQCFRRGYSKVDYLLNDYD